jgi:hypothetical protein
MHRISAMVLMSMLALALAAPAMAATTIPVSAFVKENFERAPSDEPCTFVEEPSFSFTCYGFGNAGRFGPLTSEVTFTDTSTTRIITFPRDGSTITLAEEYADGSWPGSSREAPGAMRSFGNPAFVTGTWEVIGGTGGLAGATGSGTIRQTLAGNTIQIWFEGSITLP